VGKTFTDYQEEISTELVEMPIDEDNPWANKSIMDAEIPEEILVVMIKRKQDVIVPKGSTMILVGDTLVLSGNDLILSYKAKTTGASIVSEAPVVCVVSQRAFVFDCFQESTGFFARPSFPH